MSSFEGKTLFVTGLSGSGKTTLGESLKVHDDFVHFNVDVWAFGGDPIMESAAVPGPDMIAKRNPDIKAAFDEMVSKGFSKLAAGETVEFSAWEPFYSRLCPAILAAREAIGTSKNIVVTFSVYVRAVRDYLRQHLGPTLAIVILNPAIEDVGYRKVAHLKNTATERGQTLSQFLRSFHPDSDAPDMEEGALVEILTAQARSGAVGFEPLDVAGGEDTTRTCEVAGGLDAEGVHQRVREFLATL